MTKLQEDLWQSIPAEAPRGWYPDPPKLRYWTGEVWTDEVRPVGPPVPATRVEEAWQWEWDRAPQRHPSLRAIPEPPDEESAAEEPTAPLALWKEPGVVEDSLVHMAEAPEEAAGPEEDEPRLMWELAKFALVSVLALLIGALVAAVGIAITV